MRVDTTAMTEHDVAEMHEDLRAEEEGPGKQLVEMFWQHWQMMVREATTAERSLREIIETYIEYHSGRFESQLHLQNDIFANQAMKK